MKNAIWEKKCARIKKSESLSLDQHVLPNLFFCIERVSVLSVGTF